MKLNLHTFTVSTKGEQHIKDLMDTYNKLEPIIEYCNEDTKRSLQEVFSAPFFTTPTLYNYLDFQERVDTLTGLVQTTEFAIKFNQTHKTIKEDISGVNNAFIKIIQLDFINTLLEQGVNWRNASFSRTIWSTIFDMNIGNFIRAYALYRFGDEIKEILHHLNQNVYKNSKEFLSLLSGNNNLQETMDILRPHIIKHIKSKLSQHIKQSYSNHELNIKAIHTTLYDKYPHAKQIHIGKNDFNTYISQFVSQFTADIDDDMMILLSNRTMDVITHYAKFINQLLHGKSNTIEHYFNRYLFDLLEQKYKNSHNGRIKRKEPNNKIHTQQATDYQPNNIIPQNTSHFNKIHITHYPQGVRDFIKKISDYLVNKEDHDSFTKYMKAVRKKQQIFNFNDLQENYKLLIPQETISTLLEEAELQGYCTHQSSSKAINTNTIIATSNDTQPINQTSLSHTSINIADFMIDTQINSGPLIEYYEKMGFMFEDKDQFTKGINTLNQTDVVSSRTAINKMLLGTNRFRKVRIQRSGAWVMRINSHRLVRQGNIIIGLRDHDTYEREMIKRKIYLG